MKRILMLTLLFALGACALRQTVPAHTDAPPASVASVEVPHVFTGSLDTWSGIPPLPPSASKAQTPSASTHCNGIDIAGNYAAFWAPRKDCDAWIHQMELLQADGPSAKQASDIRKNRLARRYAPQNYEVHEAPHHYKVVRDKRFGYADGDGGIVWVDAMTHDAGGRRQVIVHSGNHAETVQCDRDCALVNILARGVRGTRFPRAQTTLWEIAQDMKSGAISASSPSRPPLDNVMHAHAHPQPRRESGDCVRSTTHRPASCDHMSNSGRSPRQGARLTEGHSMSLSLGFASPIVARVSKKTARATSKNHKLGSR